MELDVVSTLFRPFVVGLVYPQYFLLIPVKNMRLECPVSLQPLSCHRLSYPTIMLGHISNVVSLRIHNDISIRLLEAEKDVHHLKLPLYNESGLCKDRSRWVALFENGIGIFGNMDRR